MDQNGHPVVNGIIAEYNPFHNGHKFQLEDAVRRTGADYTIVVMSGNFMQRGTPALLDKYKRTEMALLGGADLVIELPTLYAVSSAELFASGAVSLLDRLGVVNYLCFGSECGDVAMLQKIADILSEESDEFRQLLQSRVREGYTYPAARTSALVQCHPELSDAHDILSSPNNILGIEYLKALKRRGSAILPSTTHRQESDYHDRMLATHQSSALAIRQAVYDRRDPELLAAQMPPSAFRIFEKTLREFKPIELNDFSAQLHYKLLMEADRGYTRYLDVSPELSDRIINHLDQFVSFRGFCDVLKTRNLTYTRVSRCLMHILLDITSDDADRCADGDYVSYARVLGFRRESEELLKEIDLRGSLPLITKLADARTILNTDAYEMLHREIRINSLYLSASAIKNRSPQPSEYRTPIVVV